MQKKLNEDFIEKYSEQFAAKISEEFYASHSHISGQEILNITPSKQVNFFIIKLLFNNWQQESTRLESPFFNYGAIEVKEALLQFMNVLSRFIRVERKEFEALLQDAVRDTLFLIMAPNVYIEIEFDRKGVESLTDKLAKNILKYIRIAKPDFTSYFDSNVGLDKDDLEIDESVITNALLEEEISKLNKVLPLTLKKLEEGEDEDAVDDLLIVEADVLAAPTVARSSDSKAKSSEDPQEDPQISTEEISSETDPVEESNVSVEEEQKTPPDIAEEQDTTGPEDEVVEETSVEESESEEPEEKEISEKAEPIVVEERTEIDRGLTEPPPSPPSDESIITNMAPDEENDEDDDNTLNDKFEDPLAVPTIAESHESQADSMMTAISVNHRYMFINELFDGEADLFTVAIKKVEDSSSFDESVEILVQNYAKEYHWDMNSDEVKELLKIIFRRFR
ncbi:MAG: hypothetical protein GY816_19730 [Cytophagales bacterium]|nr:hypothetical protein [Cytophagales bacterium]